jgi:hypothetical protein
MVGPADRRTWGIIAVASLMIVFGCAEVATALTHDFFGLRTAPGELSTFAGAVLGVLYALAGLLVLTMKRPAARLAVLILVIIIAGRVFMVIAGLYSIASLTQALAMAAGTALAAAFAIFIGSQTTALD